MTARLRTAHAADLGTIHAFRPDSPDGIVRLPGEEVWLFLRPAPAGALDPAYELVFDWRDGDVL